MKLTTSMGFFLRGNSEFCLLWVNLGSTLLFSSIKVSLKYAVVQKTKKLSIAKCTGSKLFTNKIKSQNKPYQNKYLVAYIGNILDIILKISCTLRRNNQNFLDKYLSLAFKSDLFARTVNVFKLTLLFMQKVIS